MLLRSCQVWLLYVPDRMYFFWYWELTFRYGDGLGVGMGIDGIHRKEESRVFYQFLLSLLGWVAESEEKP